MIPSKFKFQEDKIIIRKMIQKGRNINKNGECRVYIEIVRFLNNGKKKTRRIPTNIMVKPQNWNSKLFDGVINNRDPDYFDKNESINSLFFAYAKQLMEREKGTWVPNFDPKDLISIDDMFPLSTKTIIDYIEDYIKFRESVNTPYNTLKNFTTLKNLLVKYEKHSNCKLNFEDINLSFSDTFQSYLLKEKYSIGTIHKTYTRLITILNYFYERREELNLKITDKFRGKRFRRGKKSENEPHPLSNLEFKTLLNHIFQNEEMRKNKKRFLIQCSLGCRYSDLFNITPDKIINGCLVYYPSKTRNKVNNKVEVPLNKISKGILEELKYDTRTLTISNQKYNDGLECMFRELIKEYPKIFNNVYTSHDARDTFITFCIQSGIDIPSLLKMVGQESYDVMKRYFKSAHEHIIESMNEVMIFN